MSNRNLAVISVAKKKQSRFEMRVEDEWLERVQRQADRYGLTVAAYVRQAGQIKLEADEATDPGIGQQSPGDRQDH